MENVGKMIKNRAMFIKNIIEHKKFNKYLEIGLSHNPLAPYRLLNNIETKHSVDTDSSTGADFVADSDTFFRALESEFFASLEKDYKWDVIFIDGNHNAEQVFKDLNNSINHLSEDGVIFVHDILPSEYSRTLEVELPHVPLSLCDAWKVIHYCLKNRPDIHICSLEEGDPNPCGLAVITMTKNNRKLLNLNENLFYQFSQILQNKSRLMNVISEDDILNWIDNPYYHYLR